MSIKDKQTYFDIQSILHEEKYYDFIIDEHLKGRKYFMSHQKKSD